MKQTEQKTINTLDGRTSWASGAGKVLTLLTFMLALLLTAGMMLPAAAPGGVADGAQDKAERVRIGEKVPDFSVIDLEGKTHKISDYKDKIVILEWINPECPFVRRQHGDGPLREMGNRMTREGIVYLAINSNRADSPGSSAEENKAMVKKWGIEYPVVLDGDSKIARMFGARTTPDMFIIDKSGVLVYSGAIDNAPLGRVNPNYPIGDHKPGFINYVEEAVKALNAGKGVAIAETHSYGCNVKY